MGFVDYGGNRRSRHEKVSQETLQKTQADPEKLRREKNGQWFAKVMGDERFATIEPNDTLKYVFHYYKKVFLVLNNTLRKETGEEETNRLLNNYFLYRFSVYIETLELARDQQVRFLQILRERLLRLNDGMDVSDFCDRREDPSFESWLQHSFGYAQGYDSFYGWILTHQANPQEVRKLVLDMTSFFACLGYYFYQSTRPGTDGWMILAQEEGFSLKELEETVNHGQMSPLSLDSLLREGKPAGGTVAGPFLRVIIFHPGRWREEGEFDMIEALYQLLKERKDPAVLPDSMIPQNVKDAIERKELPILADESGEKLHFLDYCHLYYGRSARGHISFKEQSGVLGVTAGWIRFQGEADLNIPWKKLNLMVRYENDPEIFELRWEDKTCFLQMPDPDLFHGIMKLVAASIDQKETEPTVLYDITKLGEDSSPEEFIFALGCLSQEGIPEAWKEGLEKLQENLRLWLEVSEEMDHNQDVFRRFRSYYLPELFRLLKEYLDENAISREQESGRRMEEKLKAILESLNTGLKSKVDEIYLHKNMTTMAKACALENVLHQEGYHG